MTSIGIDVGSTYTKYCIRTGQDDQFFTERTPVRQQDYFKEKVSELHRQYPDCQIVSCGYGKRNVTSVKSISELTALAAGIHVMSPATGIVLDIGGQDTKVIRQQDGKLKEFFVNEKCAAGSGLFLTNTLNILDMRFEDIQLDGSKDTVKLSTVCAVFAQSEIVELIAGGTPPEQIVSATLKQIFKQAKTLLNKLDCDQGIALSGGFTLIKGIQVFAETQLSKTIRIPHHAAYLPALGCALIAQAETA